ncbi:MAG: gliding motility lipoprotein GldH [Paludibacteraceae bacterium]|nr:gliding motility lipoprotein GldH [Paludibacteraceae bacterium]
MSSCRKGIVYSHFQPISSAQWAIDSIARFDYRITDTATSYTVLIYVRHTERYPYQNIWLFVGDSLHRDTLNTYLADDRGQWIGDKQHGFIERQIIYQPSRHYADTGSYYLDIQHGMRDSLLRGVTDVGVEVIDN